MKEKELGRKLFSIPEIYKIISKAVRSTKYLKLARKEKLISPHFQERLMLAVTEVNNCPMCSYAHVKWALDAGMEKTEIDDLLLGDLKNTPEDELNAVLFAQHYADTRGEPDRNTWELLLKEYGKDKALGILAAIRMIMVGNALGIPSGSFLNRFKGKPDPRSSLGYELSVLLLMVPMFIAGIITSLFTISSEDASIIELF
jgi:AhpD family alkylhydroperoxidase